MKQLFILTFAMFISLRNFSQSESSSANSTTIAADDPVAFFDRDHRINVYVISNYKKTSLMLLSVKIRAFVRSIFSGRKLYIVKASSSEEASAKIEKIVSKRKRFINTIWFDSHGHYGKGFSLFEIGSDQFSYKNIGDAEHTQYLKKIARFCDKESKVGIGSCYGGATYHFPAINEFPERRMNGDSLMIGVAGIFTDATVYGSESFVMNRPGMWANSYAFAGYPLDKHFNDTLYKPVWEHLGMWNKYSTLTKMIEPVNTVRLNHRGDLSTTNATYLSHSQCSAHQQKKIRNLKGGYFNMKNLYE